MTQLWTGHPAEAVASLERAARETPNDYLIQGNLGDAYRARGDTAKADAAYARSIALARAQLDLNPNDLRPRCFVATGLAKTGHIAEAQRGDGAGDRARPGRCPTSMSDAAIVAALAGRDAEALAWLRKAVAPATAATSSQRQPEFARFRDKVGISFDRRRAA